MLMLLEAPNRALVPKPTLSPCLFRIPVYTGSLSWATAGFALKTPTAPPSSRITQLTQNFVRLDNGVIAGHMQITASNVAAGSLQMVDVTDYISSCTTGTCTFVIARRLRYPAMYGACDVAAEPQIAQLSPDSCCILNKLVRFQRFRKKLSACCSLNR